MKKKLLAIILFSCLGLPSCSAKESSQRFNLECGYIPIKSKQNPDPELTLKIPNCAFLDANQKVVLADQHFKQLSFNEDGLAQVYLPKAIIYINRQKKTIRAFIFDNSADYFSEGLARTVQNGKFGFFNKKLEIVIPPQFDFATPFQNGYAKVCQGCIKKQDGEHSFYQGGRWGYINPQGKVIIPIRYQEKDLPKPDAK